MFWWICRVVVVFLLVCLWGLCQNKELSMCESSWNVVKTHKFPSPTEFNNNNQNVGHLFVFQDVCVCIKYVFKLKNRHRWIWQIKQSEIYVFKETRLDECPLTTHHLRWDTRCGILSRSELNQFNYIVISRPCVPFCIMCRVVSFDIQSQPQSN